MTRREIILWLRSRRKTKKLSQAKVHTRFSGSPQSGKSLYRWERGLIDPGLASAVAWADCLGAEIIVREKAHEQSIEESPVEPRR